MEGRAVMPSYDTKGLVEVPISGLKCGYFVDSIAAKSPAMGSAVMGQRQAPTIKSPLDPIGGR